LPAEPYFETAGAVKILHPCEIARMAGCLLTHEGRCLESADATRLNIKVRQNRSGGFGRRAARALALAQAFLFLLLFTFATSPALHLALHSDAGHADHHCAIKVLAQSQLESPAADVFVFFVATEVSDTPRVYPYVRGSGAELLPPSRAPPVVFA